MKEYIADIHAFINIVIIITIIKYRKYRIKGMKSRYRQICSFINNSEPIGLMCKWYIFLLNTVMVSVWKVECRKFMQIKCKVVVFYSRGVYFHLCHSWDKVCILGTNSLVEFSNKNESTAYWRQWIKCPRHVAIKLEYANIVPYNRSSHCSNLI